MLSGLKYESPFNSFNFSPNYLALPVVPISWPGQLFLLSGPASCSKYLARPAVPIIWPSQLFQISGPASCSNYLARPAVTILINSNHSPKPKVKPQFGLWLSLSKKKTGPAKWKCKIIQLNQQKETNNNWPLTIATLRLAKSKNWCYSLSN